VWSESVLIDAGRRLAQLHQASAGFDTTDAVWQIPAHSPAEVICLNDVAPYNMVFNDAHHLTGVIDLDTASPGPRVWDLAYLAYRLVPLTQVEDTGAGVPSMAVRRDRLRLLCLVYAAAGDRVALGAGNVVHTAIARLEDLATFTAARAAAGTTQVVAHVQAYRDDARWIEEHLKDLVLTEDVVPHRQSSR